MINLFSSKKVQVRIYIIVGLLLVYLLEIDRFNVLFSLLINSINLAWLSWLWGTTLDPSFLSDVAAFEAAIIAFLVPLSIEIISKISERYNSDVITRTFNSIWENRILPPFLLINIVAAIVLRFFVRDDIDNIVLKIFAWLVLLVFLGIAIIILRVINKIKLFMSDTQYAINQLYENVERYIE